MAYITRKCIFGNYSVQLVIIYEKMAVICMIFNTKRKHNLIHLITLLYIFQYVLNESRYS